MSQGKATTVPVQLDEPVKHGEDEYRVLEIRKPKAGDLRDLPMDPKIGDMLNLAADLAGVPYSVMDELSWGDVERVMVAVGNFMPAGPRTGKRK
jgi:hypothetical protein